MMDTLNGCIFLLMMTYYCLKTKLKSYGDEITDFYDKEIPKVDILIILV